MTAVSTRSPLVLFSILLLVGSLTLLRVINGSAEDAAYVIGMNRLRAAYAELDPGIDRYFITSKHDDGRGVGQTYNFFAPTSDELKFFASSTMFIAVVDAVMAGTLRGWWRRQPTERARSSRLRRWSRAPATS